MFISWLKALRSHYISEILQISLEYNSILYYINNVYNVFFSNLITLSVTEYHGRPNIIMR